MIKTQPDVVIYEGNYPAWPWIARTPAGQLLCTFREDGQADRKDSGHGFTPVGQMLLARSDDDGRTWSPPTVVADNPGYDDCTGAIAVLADGSWMVAYFSRFTAGGYSQAWVTRSQDEGQTWGPSIRLVDDDTRTRGAPVALSNGDILVPIYRSMFSKDGHVPMAAISSDGGKSWQVVFLPNAPGDELNEWSAYEVEPGRIIGIHRDEAEATRGTLWKTESLDFARTWTKPAATNVRTELSSAPAQLAMHGQTPVLTYAESRMVSVAMVATRDPDYLEWDVEDRVRCYQYRADGKRIADASYPCSVATGPHQRLIVDYEIESLITPDEDVKVEYELKAERKQITGHFVSTPNVWGPGL